MDFSFPDEFFSTKEKKAQPRQYYIPKNNVKKWFMSEDCQYKVDYLFASCKYEECVEACQTLLTVKNDREFLSTLILSLCKLKREEEAVPYLEQLIELNSNEPSVHVLAGKLFKSFGLYEKALSSLKKYLELRPHDLRAWIQIAECFEALNKKEHCKFAYHRACLVSEHLRQRNGYTEEIAQSLQSKKTDFNLEPDDPFYRWAEGYTKDANIDHSERSVLEL